MFAFFVDLTVTRSAEIDPLVSAEPCSKPFCDHHRPYLIVVYLPELASKGSEQPRSKDLRPAEPVLLLEYDKRRHSSGRRCDRRGRSPWCTGRHGGRWSRHSLPDLDKVEVSGNEIMRPFAILFARPAARLFGAEPNKIIFRYIYR